MTLNPLTETGIPVEKQFRNWNELNSEPYDKLRADPYTRTRVILMNGIEVESIMFSHQFARHTDNLELKRALALCRRSDQMHQKAVNGLNPGDQTPLETTIGFEQVAVDLTAWLARHEPVTTPWLLDVQAAVLCSSSAAARASAGVVSLPRLSCGRSVL